MAKSKLPEKIILGIFIIALFSLIADFVRSISGMTRNNKKGLDRLAVDDSSTEKLVRYAKAPYFTKKDKKAVEFLQ